MLKRRGEHVGLTCAGTGLSVRHLIYPVVQVGGQVVGAGELVDLWNAGYLPGWGPVLKMALTALFWRPRLDSPPWSSQGYVF